MSELHAHSINGVDVVGVEAFKLPPR